MAFVDWETAVGEIVQACSDNPRPDIKHPFFFMLGAGISFPSIPLAAGIIDQTMRKAIGLGRTDPPPSALPIDTYSYWFERAYPQARSRQGFLRGLIQGQPISPASFRLAHLLLSDCLANVAVTSNFDDFVSRALTLFGKQHVICDHPATAERIDPESGDVQIVHVHGSYWFYDCVNLREEIEGRAEASSQTVTMGSLLDSLLARRSPLVIGYAGWDGDVMMGALRRRLRRTLPYNVYWFCYRRTDVDGLPTWLQSHPQVKFVVPTAAQKPAAPAPRVEGGAKPDEPAVPTLSAQFVIEALIREFGLQAPELTRRPLTFFADSLSAALKTRSDDTGHDIFTIREVIERVRLAARLDEQSPLPEMAGLTADPAHDRSMALLRPVLDAVRRSQFREAIDLGIALPVSELARAQRIELMRVLDTAVDGVVEPAYKVRGSDHIVTIGDGLGADDASDAVDVRSLIAKALVGKGLALATLSQSDVALDAYAEVERRFGNDTGAGLREQVARALGNRGVVLANALRFDEALVAYEALLQRCRDDPEPRLRLQVVKTLVNKAAVLHDMNRVDGALASYNEAVRQFGGATQAPIRELVATALSRTASIFHQRQQYDEELAVYEDVVARFAGAPEPSLRERAAAEMFNKGVALAALGRIDAALAAYDDVIRRFESAPEPAICRSATMAAINKGIMLRGLERTQDELALYDGVVLRLRDTSDSGLRQMLALALFHKATVLDRLKRTQEAIAVYDDILTRFGETAEGRLWDEVASAAFAKGKALAAANRAPEARALFRQVIRRFAEIDAPGVSDTVVAARHALAALDAAEPISPT